MAQSLRNSIQQPSHTKAVIKSAMRSPQGRLRVWCVVESEDDVKVYSKFFVENSVSVLPSEDEDGRCSCRNVESIVSDLYNEFPDPRLFGIRDMDYTYFDSSYVCPDNVFLTDYRDIEIMMLNSESVRNGLNSWNPTFNSVIEKSMESMRFMGYLRIFNDLKQTSCTFKGRLTKVSLVWDYSTHSLLHDYEDRVLNKFKENCKIDVSDEDVSNFIADMELDSIDLNYICRGHDVCRMISVMMIKREYSDTKEIFSKMVDSYSLDDFYKTGLYHSLRDWSEKRDLTFLI